MKMTRKLMLGTAIAAVMASGSAMAGDHGQSKNAVVDALTTDAYVGVSVGMGDMGMSDDAVVGTLTYGRDLDRLVTNLGYEVELTGTLADAETDTLAGTVEGSYMSVGAYATYGYNVGQHIGVDGLDVYAKAGVAYVDAEMDTPFGTVEADDTNLAVGGGVSYDLNAVTGADVAVRAEVLDKDGVEEIKVGVTYAF